MNFFMVALLTSVKTYFFESFLELRRVVWPTPKQALFFTLAVIIMSIALAAFLGLLDWVFAFGVKALIELHARVK